MRILLLALFLGASLNAQSLSFYIDPSDGALPVSQLQVLPSTYSFPDTSVGQTANILIRVVNTSSTTLTVNAIYVGAAAGSSAANNNFGITGFPMGVTLASQAAREFSLNFTPTAAGAAAGYLQVSVAGQNNPAAISTLSGSGLASSVGLTCADTILSLCDGATPIPPNSALTFGNTTGVALGSSYSIPFTLTNNTAAAIATPSISNAASAPQSFTSPNLANLPATIAPGATVTFTIVFTPQASTTGSSSAQTATLTVGSATYTLEGQALSQTQTPSFYIDTTDGAAPVSSLQQFPAAYSFSETSVGQTASVALRVVNTTNAPITINAIYVGATAGSSAANNNFDVTDFQVGATLAPSAWKLFFVNFKPNVAGSSSGYLQISVAGQSSAAVSTLSGTGLSSSVSLTCTDRLLALCDGKTSIPANSALTFASTAGIVAGTPYSIPFTLTNNTAIAVPAPTISSELYSLPSFTSPDLASLPATIAPGSTVTFTIVFTPQATAPGPSTAQGATLTVGTATYTLQGYELITGNNDPLQVTCVYSSGQPCQGPANTASTVSVGPNPNTLGLVFTVTNPNPVGISFADITLPALPSLSDTTDFTMGTATLIQTGSSAAGTAVAAGQSVTIQPGYSLTFQVTFTGTAAATGILTIGNGISYTLTGQPAPVPGSSGSDLPGITLMCGSTPCSSQTFTSQQQVQATLQVGTATAAGATLAISFTSLVSGVTDPAVTFIAPYTQSNLNFSFTPASVSGMLSNGQPGFTFQTGTTAGTINFTLTDSATLQTMTLPPITIQPAKVQIETSTAVRSSPNLIVTITGYDNTYSAGPLSFTFYDVNGTNITPNAIQVNATTDFHQYFFSSSNTAGGAFSLQVTFPVTGDVTQIGSVTANITNSAGQATVSQAFQ